jgi:glycosyltransferase involved in cell wall biosynthesis
MVYFGRLIGDKGVHTAIDALHLLDRKGKAEGLELTVIGRGHPEYERRLSEMVGNYGLSEQVRFVPQVSRAEIPTWLSRFDAFLFTSIWPEPLARSVMEAMAAGLLVIGLTFDAGDAKSLASRIGEAREQPHHRARLARAGRKLIHDRFTLDRMAQELEQYLLDRVDCNHQL